MLYLSTDHIKELGVDWASTVNIIEEAVHLLSKGDYHQPIKPFVDFNNPKNRIIAMPARGGEGINMAGIKWIASFPENIDQGIPRAHSVTILNDESTGVPLSVINTPLLSGIRTASVSGVIIKKYLEDRKVEKLKVGIVGFGPIGQLHLQMVNELIGNKICNISIYDPKGVEIDLIPPSFKEKVEIVHSWEKAYSDADIFITCTVSSKGYINKRPKNGALLLNVSLRDFTPEILDYTRSIIVDNWEEVCRANTDIEVFHKTRNLQKKDTISIVEVVCENGMKKFKSKEAIMFHPMGMALFDLSISSSYYRQAIEKSVGLELESK